MKWIGQHIWDFISRFRSDVYLEDISTGTIANGGNLGLDSNNKIVKAAETGSSVDLTSEVTGTLSVGNGGTGATTLTDGGVLLGSGTSAITATAVLGDGEILIGDGTTDPVALDVGSSTAITVLGTVATGTWQGTAVASAYLDADTAHLSGTQTFTGDKTFEGKCTVNSRVYALPGTTVGDTAAGDVAYFGGTTSMTKGKCYYFTSSGAWALSNGGADATATGLLAIALGAASDTDGMLLRGMVTPYGPGGSDDEGKKLYLRTGDGLLDTNAPSASGNFVRIVGYMLHASNDAIYFCPDNTYVEVA